MWKPQNLNYFFLVIKTIRLHDQWILLIDSVFFLGLYDFFYYCSDLIREREKENERETNQGFHFLGKKVVEFNGFMCFTISMPQTLKQRYKKDLNKTHSYKFMNINRSQAFLVYKYIRKREKKYIISREREIKLKWRRGGGREKKGTNQWGSLHFLGACS